MTRELHLVGCRVDLDRGLAHLGGHAHALTALEVLLLEVLADADGPLARDEVCSRVWGLHPSEVGRALDQVLSRLRRKIEPDVAAPRNLVHTQGRLVLVGARAGTRPQGVVQRELDGSPGLVTVVGPPGCGKTHEARRACASHRGTVWAVAAEGPPGGDPLVVRVARAIGATAPSAAGIAHAMRAHARPLLWVDAGAELDPEAARLLGGLAQAPGCRVLVSCCSPLAVRGERRVRLGPLPIPEAIERLRASWGGGPPGVLWEVAERLDRLPYALRIAAAQRGRVGFASLLAERRAGEDWADDTVTGAHRSLGSAWQPALARLPGHHRALLRRLPELVDVVATLQTHGAVVDDLADLHARSLLRAETTRSGARRFRVPHTLRIALRARPPDRG